MVKFQCPDTHELIEIKDCASCRKRKNCDTLNWELEWEKNDNQTSN